MELSSEVIYALLAYRWSSCREIQELVAELINETQGTTLNAGLVRAQLNVTEIPKPEARLGALLNLSQTQYLRAQLDSAEATIGDFTKTLDSPNGDLSEIQLLDPSLASF